jgi:oligopeptide/dipeptide ABC transporter ATP-binding protein
VLNLLTQIQQQYGLTYLFIAHDLAVVKAVSDRVAVMYLGKIMEIATSAMLYKQPVHPYTAGLLAAVPIPDPARRRTERRAVLGGDLPSPAKPPTGCRFHTRCPHARERCVVEEPRMRAFGPGHVAACHYPLQPAQG